MQNEEQKSTQYYQVENNAWNELDAQVITETPVSLTVNSEVWLTFMCTPIDLEAMAVGFLFNEGLIEAKTDIADVRLCASGDNVDIWTNIPMQKPEKWRRTSGCTGGVTSVSEEMGFQNEVVSINGAVLTPEQVYALIESLFKEQSLYRQTGGVHTSALTDGLGRFITAEDIGRHNTLDKIAGRCLLEDIRLERRIILTTGRISSEMLQKSARLRAAIVISRTSPSSLSIQYARQYGITLIGYARRNRFNLYTYPERIIPASQIASNNQPELLTTIS